MKMALFLGMIGMLLTSEAQEIGEADSDRIYVEPAQLAFGNQGMFAYVAGQWTPVNAIHSDARGLYIEPLVSNYPYTRWICKCGYNNYGGDETCQRVDVNNRKKCGRPRPN